MAKASTHPTQAAVPEHARPELNTEFANRLRQKGIAPQNIILMQDATMQRRMEADGPLDTKYRRADLVDTLHQEVWGQGFAPPVFCEEVQVVSQRLVGEKHLALKLKHQGEPVDGIWFGHTEPLPERVKIAFRLDADEWQGQRRVRFLVEAAEV